MGSTSHGAAPSAVGYQHQTWWALAELLRSGASRPDAAITLELYDDVAWDHDGTPTDLLQVKHHKKSDRTLTDSSTDVWRTLRVWMDTARPGDPDGPKLFLVTTQTAGADTGVFALRPQGFNLEAALDTLEKVAQSSTSEYTKGAREQFLALTRSDRRTFLSKIRVIDGSQRIEDVPRMVRENLFWALPSGHEEPFLAMVWRWWDEHALSMLLGQRGSVDVAYARTAIDEIRNQFTTDTLPTLVELGDVDTSSVAAEHSTHIFVQQLQWVAYPPKNLQKAIIDYYRAYTQTVRWLDEDLIGLSELNKFEAELLDEWEREFEFMTETLDSDADEATKQQAGKQMLRQLLQGTNISVRARYEDPFFARGKRHELADAGRIGWHPDFEIRVQKLLQVSV